MAGPLPEEVSCAIHIDCARCKGCGRCVAACRSRNLTLDTVSGRKSAAVVSTIACAHGGACIAVCPFGAITEASD